jgi:lipopolysaccharide export system permease protein
MKLLEWYIFRRVAFAAVVTLLALAGVIWIIQVFSRIDLVTSSGQSILAYFKITFLAIPGLLLAVIPIALLLATANTINYFNANSELVVINASGASNRMIVKPFFVLTLLFSIFTGLVGHFIMPLSTTQLRIETSSKNADLINVILREGVFSKMDKGLMVHIKNRNPDGSLNGLLISDDRDPDNAMLYIAKRGVVARKGDQSLLLLEDGEIQQSSAKDGSSSIIRYQSYVIDMASMGSQNAEITRRAKARTTYELLNFDPDDPVYKKRPDEFVVEVHERFSEMLWPFANVLVLLAFTGQARSSRQGHSNAVAVATTLLLSTRAVGFGFQNASGDDLNLLIWLYILPSLLILFACWFLWQNKLVSLPKNAQDFLDAKWDQIIAAFKSTNERYLEFRKKKARL